MVPVQQSTLSKQLVECRTLFFVSLNDLMYSTQVPQVPDQEVPEEAQRPRLATSDCVQQGQERVRAPVLQHRRPGRGGGGLSKTEQLLRLISFLCRPVHVYSNQTQPQRVLW